MQTRRTFLKNGLIMFVATSGVISCASRQTNHSVRYGMIIVSDRCMGCNSCMSACKLQNGTAEGHFLTRVTAAETGTFPNARNTYTPDACRHCTTPPCQASCPQDAIQKLDSGIVITDWNKCTGDGACVEACPYQARFIDPAHNKADSCDFCLHRVAEGHVPACVASCPAHARLFGDMNDPQGEFAVALGAVLRASDVDDTSFHYLNTGA